MTEMIMLIVVILPILLGVSLWLPPFRSRKAMRVWLEAGVIVNSLLVFLMLSHRPEGVLTVFRFTGNLSVTFRLDSLGSVFAGLVAFLWPLATLYSFEYMEHEKGSEREFFMFYTITYGVTLGIALSENILTMYFFFEMLSLITLPLVMHTRTREAILASRTYLYYMLGGAAFAFIGMIYILTYGSTSSFVPGGVLGEAAQSRQDLMLIVYVLCFCGFSVKTALWPFSSWLPKAGVAPTPVTALLHAVAVVNTGAFAAMRVTYYSFDTQLIRGTWAQKAVMTLVIITIVYGCSRALKETHFKRRLAWSTVSNLSYILFGVVLMTPLGLKGALAHMVFHSFIKITAFFCAGAVICRAEKNYVHELDGLGRRMPATFLAFTLSGLALMGVPGLCGFVGKWYLAGAAVETGMPLAYAGVAALLISALLTAVYMMTISVRAFFPGRDFREDPGEQAGDPGWRMLLPLAVFSAVIVYFGVHSGPLMDILDKML